MEETSGDLEGGYSNLEGRSKRTRELDSYTIILVIALVLLLMFLAVIAWWLFSGIYIRHMYTSDNQQIENEASQASKELEAIIGEALLHGRYYVGNGDPPPSLGQVGSLFIVNRTSALYYKLANGTWVLGLNGTTSRPGDPGQDGPPGPPGVDGSFQGPWASNATYTNGMTVVYNSTYYVAIDNNTNVIPTDPSYWKMQLGPIPGTMPGPVGNTGGTGSQGPLGPPTVGQGTYSSLTTYNAGDMVLYYQWLYLALADGVVNVQPNLNPSLWLPLFNLTFAGPAGSVGVQGPTGLAIAGPPAPPAVAEVWSPTTNYNTSNEVIYSSMIFIAIAPSANIVPTNSSYWRPLVESGVSLLSGPGIQGPVGPAGNQTIRYVGWWFGSTAYSLGNLVYFNI